MGYYYKLIKDPKLKKLIRIQSILMWIPLLGSVASIIMMQFIMFKRNPDKIVGFDLAVILAVVVLVVLFLAFKGLLPPAYAALFYIAALTFIAYPAAFFGISIECKILYEMQEETELDAVKAKLDAAENKAEEKPLSKEPAAEVTVAIMTEEQQYTAGQQSQDLPDGRRNDYVTAALNSVPSNSTISKTQPAPLEPIVNRSKVAQMIRADADIEISKKMGKRTKNLSGHEEKALSAVKVFMTPDKKNLMSKNGASVSYSLIWIIETENARKTEILYSRPVFQEGYTCYLNLSITQGANKNGILFKLSEIIRHKIPFARQRIYYQVEEILDTISQYIV